MDSFSSSPSIRLAQIFGIYGSTILTGFLGSFSYLAVPSITIAPPDVLLKQYQKMGNIGVSTGPKIALGTAGVYAWLAWTAFQMGETTPACAYGATAVLTPMMIPYTLMFISPTNAKLNRIASVAVKDPGKVNAAEVQALIQTWAKLNYARTVLTLVASGIGIAGTLGWRLP